MKFLLLLMAFLVSVAARAQDYPFAKNFVPGAIILKDATVKSGFIKWFPAPFEQLRFKAPDQDDAVKYSFTDLLGFKTDSLQFKTLQDISVYGEAFVAGNKLSHIPQTFAQVIYTGPINIYYVLYYGYDTRQGAVTTYPNLVFEKTKDNRQEYAAFPVLIKMQEKQYEKAKQNLFPFFSEYPSILKKLKIYSVNSDIFTLVNYIKQIPATPNGQ